MPPRTLLVLSLLLLLARAAAWSRGHVGYDRMAGKALLTLHMESPSPCHEACDRMKACQSWRYDTHTHTCHLQDTAPLPVPSAHVTSGVRSRVLTPRAYTPLPVGSVVPKGWLLRQLQLQGEGLSGHLALFWPDIMSSVWIGGQSDPDLHERTPYWLNGIVPLAFLLQAAHARHQPAAAPVCQEGLDMPYGDILTTQVADAAACRDLCNATDACIAFVVDDCDAKNVQCWLKSEMNPQSAVPCRCLGILPPRPPQPVDLVAQMHKYLDYILAHQDPSGWLGPPDTGDDGNKYWGRFNVLLALSMYAEANATAFPEVSAAMLRFVLAVQPMLHKLPLQGWAASRGMDFALSVQWLLNHAPQGHEQDLYAMLQLIQAQTDNWEQWFDTFTSGANNHGVNNAQALKSSSVWYLSTGNQSFAASSHRRMRNMDATYGLPHGVFCADELLCESPQRKMPSRGTELCAVVEAVFSYNTMFSVHGDVAFADRAERIALNAQPATWSSPRGGDCWAHQYLQAVNEINAMHADPHVWKNDGPDSEIYGLEPNFGCCTANFNQGWPKYASMLFFTTPDGGVAIGAFAPATAHLPGGDVVDVGTSYPFEDRVRVTVTSARGLPLYLRIPGWADQATVTVNGRALPTPANGTMLAVRCGPGSTSVIVDLNPAVRLEQWYSNGTVSVHRGPLMYAMPITPAFTTLHTYAFQSADYQALPVGGWAFALDVQQPLTFVSTGYTEGAAPFNKTNWAVHVEASLRSLPAWGEELNSAAPPPSGPVCARGGCGAPQRLWLVPYGGTTLRIGELPIA